nr:MAG: major capsid protein [Microviridae sp.]
MKEQRMPLGGYRLGAGKKNNVELEEFSYSHHDLSNVFRSTMAAGTLVPFNVLPSLPGDEWHIELQANCLTLPTIAPVFGSFKIQLDYFSIPMRLYNSWTHNNKLNIGLNMSAVKHPTIDLYTINESSVWGQANLTQYPVNNSNILKYLGISGAGRYYDTVSVTEHYINRTFNAVPLLGYWDIYKNYYANKQESLAYILTSNTGTPTINSVVWGIVANNITNDMTTATLNATKNTAYYFQINSPNTDPLWLLNATYLNDTTSHNPITSIAGLYQGTPQYLGEYTYHILPTTPVSIINWYYWWMIDALGGRSLQCFGYSNYTESFTNYQPMQNTNNNVPPVIAPFNLTEIDDLRQAILSTDGGTVFNVNTWGQTNAKDLIIKTLGYQVTDNASAETSTQLQRKTQQGLLLKTYQSDLFNNWLNEATFAGSSGITQLTNIDVSSGYLNIDALELGYKVYRMLNQIAASGGSYDDWQIAVYNHERFAAPEIPVYLGGLSKELVFTELWSSAPPSNTSLMTNNVQQPLGTLTGKGTMSNKHKGGTIVHTSNELSYIMGIVSITPRLDYSQGNEWYTHNMTFNDWHKPHLDEIGFQDLMAEQLAWYGTTAVNNTTWVTHAVGKQPAWINYMTNLNKDYGQFAEANNLMCMVINRRYQQNPATIFYNAPIKGLTTYIEPNLYNYLFAQTSLDAQNFWMQILNNVTVRRKMSAKVMPNL